MAPRLRLTAAERADSTSTLFAVELRTTRLSEDARLPSRAHDGDAGLDLYAAEAATIAPGDRETVATGIAVEIPAGHAGLVLPRSGLAVRHGIALVNAPGLIDSGYRGEIKVLLLNTDRSEPFEVEPGDRIAQLLLTPVADAEPVEVTELAASVRGDGGFGSSGR
jgi:dUTP pyrophosphatase